MGLDIASSIRSKLTKKHGVSEKDIVECFSNIKIEGAYLIDTRAQHKTDPPSKWFIASTDFGRKLKVVFIEKNGCITIKTAYEPNEEEVRIYKKYSSMVER